MLMRTMLEVASRLCRTRNAENHAKTLLVGVVLVKDGSYRMFSLLHNDGRSVDTSGLGIRLTATEYLIVINGFT